MFARQLCRLLSRPGQQGKEELEPLGLELEVGRQLPENGPEFRPESQQPLGKEVRQRSFDIPQAKHVGYIPRALDGKSKVLRRLGMPSGKTLRPLQRVERSIQLDGIELPRGKLQLSPLRQFLRVKDATPAFISPARNADMYRCPEIPRIGCSGSYCGATRLRARRRS